MALFGFLKKIGMGKSGGVLGVDVGSSAIKFVELKYQGGRAVLRNYGSLALGPYAGAEVGQAVILSKEKLAEAMLDLLHEARVTTRKSVLAIPMKGTMITFVQMPDLEKDKLRTMIPIEARKYVPVPMSEVALDWWVIPPEDAAKGPAASHAGGEKKPSASDESAEAPDDASPPNHSPEPSGIKTVDVMLAAIRNDSLELIQGVKERAGLTGDVFEIEIFSTMRSVIEDESQTVLLVDMGAASTKLAIAERGIVRDTHTIHRGAQDITAHISKAMTIPVAQAEELKRAVGLVDSEGAHAGVVEAAQLLVPHVFTEARQVLEKYERKGKKVDRAVLTGGGALMKGIATEAEKYLKTDIAVGDSFGKIQAPAFLSDTLKEIGPEFAVAAGAALKGLRE